MFNRFKRGSKSFKGSRGQERIGLGFEETSSKSTAASSNDPLPDYLTSNSSITTRTDTSGKFRTNISWNYKLFIRGQLRGIVWGIGAR